MNELIEAIRTLELHRLAIFSFLFGAGVVFSIIFSRRFSFSILDVDTSEFFSSKDEKNCYNPKLDTEFIKILATLDNIKKTLENNDNSSSIKTDLIVEKIEFLKHSILEIKDIAQKNNQILDRLDKRSRDQLWK